MTLLQTRIKEGVDPPEDSKRTVDFDKNRQFLKDVVKGVIHRRRDGSGEEHVPFIDNLLQSGVAEDQASIYSGVLVKWTHLK